MSPSLIKPLEITVDMHKVMKEHFEVRVQYKNMWRMKLGLFFLKIGCWISGATLVDEFPMSLIQPDEKEA